MDFEQILNQAEAELAAGVTQGTAAWRQERAGRFTGSKMHLLYPGRGDGFNEQAHTYILQKAAEVIKGRPMDTDINSKHLRHGLETEAEAFTAASQALGIEPIHPGFLRWGDYAGASPDGLVPGEAVLEIKCPYSLNSHLWHCTATSSETLKSVDKKYWCQVQAEIAAADVDVAYFVSYWKTPSDYQYNPATGEREYLPIGPMETHLHIAAIRRDEAFTEVMLPRIEKAAELRQTYIEALTKARYV